MAQSMQGCAVHDAVKKFFRVLDKLLYLRYNIKKRAADDGHSHVAARTRLSRIKLAALLGSWAAILYFLLSLIRFSKLMITRIKVSSSIVVM